MSDRERLSIKRRIDHESISEVAAAGPIDSLSITDVPLVTVRHAALLAQGLPTVRQLWLWAKVTRSAMSHLIELPGLETLDVLQLTSEARWRHVDRAVVLQQLRIALCLNHDDLIAISRSHSIRELSVRGASLTRDAFVALLDMPKLESLDVEETVFDDWMAARVSRVPRITALDVGASRMTGSGLRRLAQMSQLRSLDIWATRIETTDLATLTDLTALEYLSVGGYAGVPNLEPEMMVAQLLRLPSLKKVWIDGVPRTDTLHERLSARIEKVLWS